MAPASLTLSQVAAYYGISETSILLYEEEGVVSAVRVDGVRYYSREARVRIEIVLKGKQLGFSLSEIKRLIDAHLPAPNGQSLGTAQIEHQLSQMENERDALQAAIDRLVAKKNTDP